MGGIFSSVYGGTGNSLGTAAVDLFGDSPPGAPNLQVYQPQYTSQADTGAFQGIQAINANNPYLQNQGTYADIMNAGLNNPYAAGNQAAANSAGAQYGAVGSAGAAGSAALNAGANQTLNTAFDPQNALYNRTLQQVTDQANVQNAQNGLTGSPFGAGVADASNQNFNINWQNNQLGRQATGLSAAGGAMTTALSNGSNAAAATGLSGAVPNAAYLTNLNNQSAALNNYGTSQVAANANTQTAVGDFLQYMGQGEQQSNAQAIQTQQTYLDQVAQANAVNAGIAGLFPGYGSTAPGPATSSQTAPSSYGGTSAYAGGDGALGNGQDTSQLDSQDYAVGGSGEAANNSNFMGGASDQSLYASLF